MKITKSQLKSLIKESVCEVVREQSQPFKTSDEAYFWAKKNGPSDESRKIASEDPASAYDYAIVFDKKPHDVTREGASKDFRLAYNYAANIDEEPHDVTRKGASQDPETAYRYAKLIDEAPHDVTREGASKNPIEALRYAVGVDKKSHPVTYASVLRATDKNSLNTYHRHLGKPIDK